MIPCAWHPIKIDVRWCALFRACVNFKDVFLVPITHALLLGVVKTLLAKLFRSQLDATGLPVAISHEHRHFISVREKHVGFGRIWPPLP